MYEDHYFVQKYKENVMKIQFSLNIYYLRSHIFTRDKIFNIYYKLIFLLILRF